MLAYQDDVNHYVTLNSRFKNIKRDFKNSTDLRPICTDLRHAGNIVVFFEKSGLGRSVNCGLIIEM
jgi:hypothetical protein